MMPERVDELTSRIEELTAQIDEQVAPFAAQVAQLDAVTGIGLVGASELTGRARRGHGRLPDRRAPGGVGQVRSPGQHLRRQGQDGGHRQGQPVAGRHPRPRSPSRPGAPAPFLGERYRRIAKRRGKQRALVAVGNSVLTIVWHPLADPKPATATWVPTSTSPTATGSARNAT
jgi:hypothetical protein